MVPQNDHIAKQYSTAYIADSPFAADFDTEHKVQIAMSSGVKYLVTKNKTELHF